MSKYSVTVSFEAFDDADALQKTQALRMVTGGVFENPDFALHDSASKAIPIPASVDG
jgi:hypothetical protein